MRPWRSDFQHYLAVAARRGRAVPAPVSDADLVVLLKQAGRLGLTLDEALLDLYRIANGTSYDSVRIYGAGVPPDDPLGRLDLIEANRLIEERGADTLFGEWQDEFFVRCTDGRFERRAKATGDAYDEYGSGDELLAAVFAEEIGLLRRRLGEI